MRWFLPGGVVVRRRSVVPPVLVLLLALVAPTQASAGSAPMCGRHPATLVGTPGPDHLVGRSDHAVIVGLGGDDDISGAFRIACGGRGDDTIEAGSIGGAREFGGPGDDFLDHAQFVDLVTMIGGRGNDTMEGYSSLVEGGPGDDVMDAGFGTVSYAHAARPIVAHLDRGTVFGEGRDRVSSLAGFVASPFADHVFGTASETGYLEGLAGDDVLSAALDTYGGGGDDTIRSGPNSDDVRGGAGDDTLYGGGGDDILHGNTGSHDSVFGGPGDDLCRAEAVAGCER